VLPRERHALAPQAGALRNETGGEAAGRVDDAVAGHRRIAAVVHREADEPRRSRVSREHRHGAVRRHATAWDAPHDPVDALVVPGHALILAGTSIDRLWRGVMSETERNKTVIRKIEEAWTKDDVASLDQYLAPDFHPHSTAPGTPATLESAKTAHAMSRRAFPDRTKEMLDIIAEGDRVFIRTRVQGTNTGGASWFGAPPNGKPFDIESWAIYRLKDGKVVEWQLTS